MMRLIDNIKSIPNESLILWKKFAYIKKLLKQVKNDDLSETNALLFATFICNLGIINVSDMAISTTDPADKIIGQVKIFFDTITDKCKAATADDLISITIALLPDTDNFDEIYARINMLYQIRYMQYGDDSLAGCLVTLMAAITAKRSLDEPVDAGEYDVYVAKLVAKLKEAPEDKEFKEHYRKLFESSSKSSIVEDTIAAYEQVFEFSSSTTKHLDLFDFHRGLIEIFLKDAIKNDPEVFKKYFEEKKESDAFSLLLRDCKDPGSVISVLLAKNIKLKVTFEQYVQAINISQKALKPKESNNGSYFKYFFG